MEESEIFAPWVCFSDKDCLVFIYIIKMKVIMRVFIVNIMLRIMDKKP